MRILPWTGTERNTRNVEVDIPYDDRGMNIAVDLDVVIKIRKFDMHSYLSLDLGNAFCCFVHLPLEQDYDFPRISHIFFMSWKHANFVRSVDDELIYGGIADPWHSSLAIGFTVP